MEVLFCTPTDRTPGDNLDREIDALEYLDIPYHVLPIEDVIEGFVSLPERDAPCPLLYRGYMLSEDDRADLHDALAALGYHLRVSPDDYARAHHLPRCFDAIAPFASPTRFTQGFDPDEVWEAASDLGPVPRMLKDHVKSAKHDWWGACYLCSDAERADCDRTLEAMCEARGEELTGGVTLRALADLRVLGTLPGGAPAHEEYRALLAHGELLGFEPIWTDLTLAPQQAPRHLLERIGAALELTFCSVDLAITYQGDWVAVEVGAGSVSRLPDSLDLPSFYEDLREALF